MKDLKKGVKSKIKQKEIIILICYYSSSLTNKNVWHWTGFFLITLLFIIINLNNIKEIQKDEKKILLTIDKVYTP